MRRWLASSEYSAAIARASPGRERQAQVGGNLGHAADRVRHQRLVPLAEQVRLGGPVAVAPEDRVQEAAPHDDLVEVRVKLVDQGIGHVAEVAMGVEAEGPPVA